MQLKNLTIRAILSATLICGMINSALALDLPIKEVNGKNFYYYKVQKGETIYSLTHRFGITYDDMLKSNSWISEGLKYGKTLYFPVEDFSDNHSKNNTKEHKVKKGDTLYSLANKYGITVESIVRLNPGVENGIKKGEILVIPNDDSVMPVEEELVEVETPDTNDSGRAEGVVYEESDDNKYEFTVAVMLPFMLNESKPGKVATYATDFYRGLLLGIDSLRYEYGNPHIAIHTIDTESSDDFSALSKNSATLRMADLIVAPDNAEHLDLLNKFGEQNQIYIFNNFQARDISAKQNPYAIQGNILQPEMFAKAIDYFVDNFSRSVPVFLDNTNGTKDKEAFVNQLKERLEKEGIHYETLSYTGSLSPASVSSELPFGTDGYVFIPMSGLLAEFNKFAGALKSFEKEASEYSNPCEVRLFGYPEYTRFSNDALDDLSRLNTTFYSRFYNENNLGQNDRLNASFYKWYGTLLPDGVPNQALYGFDAARLILSLASKGEITPKNLLSTHIEYPSQQAYYFRQEPNGGFVNDALFFVTIGPGMSVKTEIK